MEAKPLVMRGVIEEGYVFVTDDIPLPWQCKVLVQIVPATLGPEDDRTPAEMTAQEIAEAEALFSEFLGRPFKLMES